MKKLLYTFLGLFLLSGVVFAQGSIVGGDGIGSTAIDLAALGGLTNPLTENLNAGGFDITNVGTLSATILQTTAGDITISDTTPALNLKDTDTTDTDVIGSIDLNATDTGSGTEDGDMTFKQMINGTLTTWLSADADGLIDLAGGGMSLNRISQIISTAVGWDFLGPRDDAFASLGNSNDTKVTYDSNGTGDSVTNFNFGRNTVSDSPCFLISVDYDPNNLTLIDDCLSPTALLLNQNGADTGDAVGLLVGSFQDADVSIDNYTRILPFQIDADGTTDEKIPFLLIGSSGGSNDHALAPGSAIFTDDTQFNGESFFASTIHSNQGADIASSNDLTLGSDGNSFEITGTTQINAITTTGWTNGDQVKLWFTSGLTLKNNTAGGGGTAVMLLDAGTDNAPGAGDGQCLELIEIGGTQAWRSCGIYNL